MRHSQWEKKKGENRTKVEVIQCEDSTSMISIVIVAGSEDRSGPKLRNSNSFLILEREEKEFYPRATKMNTAVLIP